jgi:hypothetical protein
MLEVVGGYVTQERGSIDVKVVTQHLYLRNPSCIIYVHEYLMQCLFGARYVQISTGKIIFSSIWIRPFELSNIALTA